MVNPLSLETPPGTHVGKHIGKMPILFALLFAFLLLGGIIFGAVNRMNRSDAVSQPPEVVQEVQDAVPAQPFVITEATDDTPAIVLEEEYNTKGKPKALAPRRVQTTGAQDAIIEFRNRQKLEELQARAAGQQSISKVSFDPVNDAVQPTSSSVKSNTSTKIAVDTTDRLRQQALLNALSGRAASATDQNNQSEKISFAEKERRPDGYLLNPVTAPLSPYELKTGSVIPGLLLTALNSDLPGAVLGQVRTNVYDSSSGRHLLIPQGSRLIGQYDSRISYGQDRALVVWTRLVFPDGTALNLSNMAGVTQSGESGFKDKVNKHYGRVFGSILGLSIFQAIPAIIKGDETTTPSASSSELEKITAANISKTGERMIEKNLAIQPTIRIRAGYRFNILVNKDILFPGAYRG